MLSWVRRRDPGPNRAEVEERTNRIVTAIERETTKIKNTADVLVERIEKGQLHGRV